MAEPTKEQLEKLKELDAREYAGYVLRRNSNPKTITVVKWGQTAPLASLPYTDNESATAAFVKAIAAVDQANADDAAREARQTAEKEEAMSSIDKLLADAKKAPAPAAQAAPSSQSQTPDPEKVGS